MRATDPRGEPGVVPLASEVSIRYDEHLNVRASERHQILRGVFARGEYTSLFLLSIAVDDSPFLFVQLEEVLSF
jgi:hypothetical protein